MYWVLSVICLLFATHLSQERQLPFLSDFNK